MSAPQKFSALNATKAVFAMPFWPQECSVFKSAMLPLRLSFRLEAAPFDWRTLAPRQPHLPQPGSAPTHSHCAHVSSGRMGDADG